jgi:hypothetical protein
VRITFLVGACALAIVSQTGCSAGTASGSLPLTNAQNPSAIVRVAAAAVQTPLTVRPIPVIKIHNP